MQELLLYITNINYNNETLSDQHQHETQYNKTLSDLHLTQQHKSLYASASVIEKNINGYNRTNKTKIHHIKY